MKIPKYAEEIINFLNSGQPLDILQDSFENREYELEKGFVYLKEKGLIDYVQTLGRILPSDVRITSKGVDYLEGTDDDSQKNSQTINIHAPVQNIAQVQGNNNTTTQTVDNSQYNILKQLIENDSELDQLKKTKLFDLLDKFNKVKETGENAYDLVKTVGGIATKYAPLFFSLLQ